MDYAGNEANVKERESKVIIHSDGACSGNPGPGAWAALVEIANGETELAGFENITTNNRMELMAAIMALESLIADGEVELVTDSQYLRKGAMSWIKSWKKNGWRTSARKPVKNSDLWQRLDKQLQRHDINWLWVRGHTGNEKNERVDQLAREQIEMNR